MFTDEELKNVFNNLKKAYTDLDVRRFCELLELNPKWDDKYFIAFQTGIRNLFELDDDNLIALINYGESHRKGK